MFGCINKNKMATGGTGTATNTLRTILGGTPLIGDSLAVGNTTIENDTLSISSINANNAYVLSAFVSEAHINKLYLPEISVVSLNADYGRISRLSGVSLSFENGFVSGLSSTSSKITVLNGTTLSYQNGQITALSGTAITYAGGFFSNQVSALNGNISQLNVSNAAISTLNVSTINVSTIGVSQINVSTITASTVNATLVSSQSAQFNGVVATTGNIVFLNNVAMSTLSEQALELWSNSVYVSYLSGVSLSVAHLSVLSISASYISVVGERVGTLCATTIVANDITVSNALRVSKSTFQFNIGGGMTTGSPSGAWVNLIGGVNTAIQAEQQGVAYRNLYLNPNGGDVLLGQTSTGTVFVSNRLQVGGAPFMTDIQAGALLTVGNNTISDITVTGTVSGHGVYIQAGFGAGRHLWIAQDAVANNYNYIGTGAADAVNPDMFVTLKHGTGVQIALSTGEVPDFTEQFVVLGKARISDLTLGTASVLSFQAVSAYMSYLSVVSISAGNISVGNFNATSANITTGYTENGLVEAFTAQTGNFGLMQAISGRFRAIEQVNTWGATVLSVVITNAASSEGYMLLAGNPGLRPCLQFVSYPSPLTGQFINWTFPMSFTIPLGCQATTTTSGTTTSLGKMIISGLSNVGVHVDPCYGIVNKTAAYILAYGLV